MKKTHLLTMSALLFSAVGVSAQTSAYTKPVGYVTHNLKAGQFNLVGLTLHNPVEVTGSFTFVNETGNNRVFDTAVDFSTLLTDDVTYILEITSGLLTGTIQEVTRVSGDPETRLVTPDDLSVDGLAAGDTYQIREATTVQDVFGDSNEAGLQAGNENTADLIWVTDGNGLFDKYYYSAGATFPVATPAGWKTLAGQDAGEIELIYADSVIVERRGTSDLDVVVSGSIKTQSVVIAIPSDFTFISSVFPVGSTLDNCGLSDSIVQGNENTADLVWIQKDDASDYDRYYFHSGSTFPVFIASGWKSISSGTVDIDATAVDVRSGMIIEKRSVSDYNVRLNPPANYEAL